VAIPFHTAVWDYGDLHDANQEETTTITLPLTGLWDVGALVEWNGDSGASGVRELRLVLNERVTLRRSRIDPADPNANTGQLVGALHSFQAGDTLSLEGWHDSADGDVLVNSGETSTRWWLRYVGPIDTTPGAWTTPKEDWANGNVPTAAQLTAIGTNIQNLRYCRGAAAAVRLTANQSIANNTVTSVDWDETEFELGSMWPGGSGNTHLVAAVAGRYGFWISVHWGPNNAGARYHGIRVNSTTVYDILESRRLSTTTLGHHLNSYVELDLAASAQVDLRVWQNSGGALAVKTSQTRLAMMLLGAA
jgi:hypothetical protein